MAAMDKELLNNQSVDLGGGVRTSHLARDGNLITYYYEDVQTLYEGFLRGVKVSNDGEFLGTRKGDGPYSWITYKQAYNQARQLGSAFKAKGLESGEDTFIGVYSNNRAEWVITEQACNMFSMVLVPLYDTLGPDACTYIINQTGMNTVVCDKKEKATVLLKSISETPSLKQIIVMDSMDQGLVSAAKEKGVDILLFQDMLDFGQNNITEPVPPKPDNLATICYTSGTTGNPKGVMLTHKNIISNVAAVYKIVNEVDTISPSDVHISYLPLAHMFERAVESFMIMQGCHIGFFRGDVKLLLEDIKVLKPTFFPVVPRLLNRIYDKTLQAVSASKIKSILFNFAMSKKQAEVEKGIIRKDSIWDKLVFKKVQEGLGGRLRLAVTGSAPISEKVMMFCRCAFGCPILEGYGQTEGNAGLTVTLPADTTPGPVGPPLPCNLIKLDDVSEMNYFAKDGKGEVCAKGPNIMRGYLKQPEKTAETIDSEGWLHTGDIGMWMPNGTLKIIDRKKHIFKLAQGEYIAPEKIENIYMRASLVAQMFVDGNSLQPCLVGIAVPDPEVLPGWASDKGLQGNFEQLCQKQEVKDAILKEITDLGKKGGLKSFEQVKAIHIHPELFSVENGFLTPTFKSKRPQLRQFFQAKMDEMYSKM
ncbi:unnamed protein product [Owenia fusiformis]|uniref:Long-chain-fatty-acid--CoA ligase n=1 Tax=Owenia fusiformis TaxID=6347 RepID=A0A8J1UMH9_OWEFU|nr:unnamed protein product [Owenia fusiformis]